MLEQNILRYNKTFFSWKSSLRSYFVSQSVTHVDLFLVTKFPQQNIELGLQVSTGTVSEQQFSELLSSSLVECLLLTPKVPGSNPETGGMWEGERTFRVLYSESKGPTGRSQIFQMLSDSTIAYSQEPTTAPAFRGGPNMRSTWPTSQSLLLK